ncbi:MAG: glycerophosphoryl diester phosphodiesterase membrane domain-containing protein [Erysipelotrichaceae bacterium]|nr:glycerophosphoryl diester phosphodiesterase membrane domain-containing protein [Erysipelotrichaceae bacterium]
MKDRDQTIVKMSTYVSAVPDIFGYQFLSKFTLGILIFVLNRICMALLKSTGRVAISSGDLDFLYKTWQGPLLIVIAIASLFLYTTVDINIQIIYASKLLEGEKIKITDVFREGLRSIRKLFNIDGLRIVLYLSLIAPIINLGVSISLTKGLYVPAFITSVIRSSPLYSALYFLICAGFLLIGFFNFFVLHGILISDLPGNKADDNSRAIIKANWKDYIKKSVFFSINIIMNLLFVVMLSIMSLIAVKLFGDQEKTLRFILIMAGLFLCIFTGIFGMLSQTFLIIKITRLYYHYMDMDEKIDEPAAKRSLLKVLAMTVIISAMAVLASFYLNARFDYIFIREYGTGIIAHRGGGNEAPENTVKGIETAISLGAYGSEIDIQRTMDGYYVVNHDANFSRLCSDARKPEEMSLAEIKSLVINDPNHPGDPQKVATFEEMLEAAKDRIVLFVELKGNTADTRMVDDAARIIREHGMEDQCVLISLKYNIIDYAMSAYPDIDTAYLTFASFGRTADLNCDYLGLEDESATGQIITAIHDQDKKVLVWTPNSESRQRHFLMSYADYIITDNVKQAKEILEDIRNRNDYEIIVDWILQMIF